LIQHSLHAVSVHGPVQQLRLIPNNVFNDLVSAQRLLWRKLVYDRSWPFELNLTHVKGGAIGSGLVARNRQIAQVLRLVEAGDVFGENCVVHHHPGVVVVLYSLRAHCFNSRQLHLPLCLHPTDRLHKGLLAL